MEFSMRLCHFKSFQDEYGFNIASKSYPLCYHIGRVDPNTPAHLSGLKNGKFDIISFYFCFFKLK
jgi:hypothetical protein